MPDEDYSAYLKRQSYDDLIAISCSLNKDGHPDLYAMVVAEIAERDKRGETKENKRRCNSAMIALGLLFAVIGVVELCTGSAYTKNGHQVTVAEKPQDFWFLVCSSFAFAAFGLYRGLKNKKIRPPD
jgi:hypothetical protein